MARKKSKPGPEADRLKLGGDWKDRLAEAVRKKRPEGGWPDPDNRQKAKAQRPKKSSQ